MGTDDYCSGDEILLAHEDHMDIYIQLKMQTTAPRDETRLGVGWQISGRAVAAVILLPIDVRYAWQQGGAVGTCYCVIILQ